MVRLGLTAPAPLFSSAIGFSSKGHFDGAAIYHFVERLTTLSKFSVQSPSRLPDQGEFGSGCRVKSSSSRSTTLPPAGPRGRKSPPDPADAVKPLVLPTTTKRRLTYFH